MIVWRLVLLCLWLAFTSFYLSRQTRGTTIVDGEVLRWAFFLIVYVGPPVVLAVAFFLLDRLLNPPPPPPPEIEDEWF